MIFFPVVSALYDGDLQRLGAGTADVLHQPYRAPLVRGFHEARAAALEIVRKGLGPGATPDEVPDTRTLPLDQLTSVIASCALVISNDSGPVHLADAFGVKTLALFGPTSPRRWAPRGPGSGSLSEQLVCSPCSNHGSQACPIGTHACMTALTSQAVLERALAMLGPEPEVAPLQRAASS